MKVPGLASLMLILVAGCDPKEAAAPPRPAGRVEGGPDLRDMPSDERLRCAEELLAQDRLADAAAQFQRVLQRDENNVSALLGLSRVALRMDDAPSAIAYARRAADLRPEDGPVLNQLGVALVSKGQPREASQAFDRALARSPKDPLILLNAANCWAELQAWERAQEFARRAAELMPESPTPHAILGRIQVRQGKHAEAVPHFREAVRWGADQPVLHYHLGKALMASGQGAEAAEELRAALRGNPPPEIRKEVEALLAGR